MKAFDNSEFEAYQAEAKEKWGGTAAYRDYEQKTKNYTAGQWQETAEGMDRLMGAFAACMKQGAAPDSAEARQLVKRLQDYITERCYPCTKEILAGLGQMYTADERFRKNVDRHADGTAAFLREAIGAYCGR